MTFFKPFALSGLLLASSATFAVTPAEGWYAGIVGGLTYSQSVTIDSIHPIQFVNHPYLSSFLANTFPRVPGTLDFNLGGNIGGQVGYRICNFRVEGELLFNYIPFSKIKVRGFTIKKHVYGVVPVNFSGNAGFGAGFINGFYDFYDEGNDPTWVPYLGLGIGYSHIKSTTTFNVPYLLFAIQSAYPYLPITPFSPSFTYKRGTSTAMGQAIIGLGYYFSDTSSLSFDYRYMSTRTIANLNGRLQTNAFNLTWNYFFDN